jgi:hypothetical protein
MATIKITAIQGAGPPCVMTMMPCIKPKNGRSLVIFAVKQKDELILPDIMTKKY